MPTEFSTPAKVDVDDAANLTDAVFDNARDHGDTVLFQRRSGGSWQDVTSKDFANQVSALAAGLIASGIEPGQRVGLMSATRFEWTLIDYAIWTAGAVTVPIYETSSSEQIQWILSDSEAVAVFLEADTHRKAYEEAAGELKDIQHVWVIDDGALDELTGKGGEVAADTIEERRRSLTADSAATIIYTSGTTGRPKGCELTHRNFLWDSRNTTEGLSELFGEGQSTLLFLPLAHVFARLIQIGCVLNRVRMGHTADVKNLLGDLAAFKPTFILSVPRVFEKVYNSAKQKAHSEGKGAIFDRAEAVAVKWSEGLDSGGPGVATKAQHAVFDKLVYSKLRAALGGEVHHAVSGGAPLGARLGHFFRGIGLTVLEGYGLTETTAGAALNLPDAMKIGTVGRPVPGVTIKIGDDGEILIKGGNIFRGYWHNDDATGEALTDGWFHTGDIGELDGDGFLKITGRKKELIVTAGGKNVSPAGLEDRLRAHPLISQAMVVGDNKPFIACLVTIDDEAFPGWKKEHGKPADASVADLADDEDLRNAIQSAVADANKSVSKAESIRAFRILDADWTEESGHLTPTMKVKRNVVLKDFDEEIEALYSGGNTKV